MFRALSLLTADSAFLVLDDDMVATTRRTNPALDGYEGRPVDELEVAIEAAVAGR